MRKKEGKKKTITFSLNRLKVERRIRSHVAMVPKFLDLNKPWSPFFFPDEPKSINRIVKGTTKCMTFLFMIALRNKTVAHDFLPSFDKANDRHY